jgi:hypothetical protein
VKFTPLAFLFLASAVASAQQSHADFLATYKGTPYTDAHHPTGAQPIPGIVQCAYYDAGGEGIAYHDTDAVNHGSGELNPPNGTYLNEFRMHEGVDTSYTKFHSPDIPIDNNPYDLVTPPADQLYVGWTVPGEWFNLTVNVAHAGLYTADLLYTSNRGGTISLDVKGTPTAPITIPSTFSKDEPVAWRQWHHWNLLPNAATLKLPAGRSVLTVHILTEGQMNLATLAFKPAP